ncbi:MAG TPA: hypothetical protein VKB57_20045 [Acidimicrobiales bacterium]|nr:hypothetical protein [Acidimicrobiales bacterium]
MGRIRPLAAAVVVVLTAASCQYLDAATNAQNAGGPLPWWCTSTEEIPVNTGPAVGSVDYYAGTHKAPLSWADCRSVSAQFDIAKAYALQWPTEGAAEADGWRMATSYVAGMGTHHVRGGITPAMLADPSFDRQNPILDAAGLDDVFDSTRPEVLQFDGNGPSARLVGFDYYVRTDTGRPPEGFPGTNDWWHIHPMICFRTSDAAMVAFNTSDANCTAQRGVNVNMSNYYMLHVWVLDDMTYEPDVYAGMMPCIFGGTAIHDATDPCHTSRTTMAAAATHDIAAMGL